MTIILIFVNVWIVSTGQSVENPKLNSDGVLIEANLPEFLFGRTGINFEIPFAKKYSFVAKPMYLMATMRNLYPAFQMEFGIKNYYKNKNRKCSTLYYTGIYFAIRKSFFQKVPRYIYSSQTFSGDMLKLKLRIGKVIAIDNFLIELYWGPGLSVERKPKNVYWAYKSGHCIDYKRLTGYKYIVHPVLNAGILIGIKIH